MNPQLRAFLILFLTVCTLVMVGLAVGLPLGGHSTAYVSNRYYSALTPAGWAFSIWGLIYSGVIGFAFWQALPSQRTNSHLATASPWIMGMLICNGIWLPAWHYVQLPLSLAIIAAYLFCAVRTVDAFSSPRPTGGATYWLGFVLFSVNAGWLTIATVANATVVALSTGLDFGLPNEAWAVILLSIAFLIAWALFSRWQSPAYFLVITWAFAAIASAHRAQWTVYTTALTLGGLAALLAAGAIYQAIWPASKTDK